jgi:hypothetical protein
MALAAALAAAWAALPPAVRAQENNVRQDISAGGAGDRERREGMGGQEGREGPRGPEGDPDMRTKLDKMRDLDMKVREAAKSLHKGTDSEKAAAKVEVRKALGDLFDARLVLDEAVLANMEKHIVELKTKIARKKTSREKAIESRLARMNGEADEWD